MVTSSPRYFQCSSDDKLTLNQGPHEIPWFDHLQELHGAHNLELLDLGKLVDITTEKNSKEPILALVVHRHGERIDAVHLLLADLFQHIHVYQLHDCLPCKLLLPRALTKLMLLFSSYLPSP